ncbi:5'-nucleotidase [Vibrio ishigakensis]|uniref:5'-nucleotidase n=1 Tax=Vibrio ishigakensis TaxID=1481914 RepID=A0A0B8QG74_9VIBR|nr:5'-nucleotidase [Vibrio ishigakensis]
MGNHELDMGNGPVAEFAKQIEFPLLCGNWDLSNEDRSKSNPLKVWKASSLMIFHRKLRAG